MSKLLFRRRIEVHALYNFERTISKVNAAHLIATYLASVEEIENLLADHKVLPPLSFHDAFLQAITSRTRVEILCLFTIARSNSCSVSY
jgi:hypothetical protein